MNKRGNTRLIIILACVMTGFILFQWAVAGDLDPVAGPSIPGSAMYTLTDIYNRLFDNTAGTKRTGAFAEPGAAPEPTGYTLDEIYNIAIPTQVPKSGQTTSVAAGDDGGLQAGVAHPVTRFVDNGDGTVTDSLTGLIWLKNANCFGALLWPDALVAVNGLQNEGCGLSDGSVAGDWRMPNIKELLSLIDYGRSNPALPTNYDLFFTEVQRPRYFIDTYLGVTLNDGAGYWTSTTVAGGPYAGYDYGDYRWGVNMYYGQPVLITGNSVVDTFGPVWAYSYFTWPVRGGR